MIDYISINELFWAQIHKYLISFGNNELPDNIHYTIAFNENSPDINFHLTKNINTTSNKPKVRIVCIDKKLLEEVSPSLFFSFIATIFKPVDIIKFKRRNKNNLTFIPFDIQEQNNDYSQIHKNLIDHFKSISELRKKTRLKIKGNVRKIFKSFTYSKEFKKIILNNVIPLTQNFQIPFSSGILISKRRPIYVVRFGEYWFTIKENLELYDILTIFINPEIAKKIISNTKEAIEELKTAETYEDVKHLDNPIRLIN